MFSCRLGFLMVAILMLCASAFAQSSLGIGAAEAPATKTAAGPFAGLFTWIAVQQADFYRLMTGSLRDLRTNPVFPWSLISLSFAYGILHAAGPGHGKVVISSYLLATNTQLRRGVMISLYSSVLQAISAILIVGFGFLLLRQLSISVTDTTVAFELASYAMVALLGFWLVLRSFLRMRQKPIASLSAAVTVAYDDDHSHAHGETCLSCGHAHMPSPSQVQRAGTWREALAAIVSVGLRPCTGALVVLTFSFMNGLWWAGLMSAFVMSLGTAITVSTLAAIAVGAKGLAKRYAGVSTFGPVVINTIEVIGGLMILLMGISLFGSAIGR